MKLRSLFLTMLLIFAVVIGGVSAQDSVLDSPCLNLGADDCAAISAAQANGFGDATSFTIEIDVALEASIPAEEGADSMAFYMSGAIDVAEGMGMLIPVNMAGSFDIEATENDEMMLPPMTLEFALVDDFFYFTDPMTGEWAGLDLLTAMASDEFNEMIAPLMDGDLSGLSGATGVDVPDPEGLIGLLAILELPGLLDYSRDGDDFVLTIDFAALQALMDPENAELLEGITAVVAESDEDMAEMVAFLPMLISDGAIEVIQTVNTDLNIVENIEIVAYLELAMGADPLTVDLGINIALTNLDEAPAPEAPEQFEDITGDFVSEDSE